MPIISTNMDLLEGDVKLCTYMIKSMTQSSSKYIALKNN